MDQSMTDVEVLLACLYEAVGDDAAQWETGDGWPVGRFLVPALAGDIATARSQLLAYRAERDAAEREHDEHPAKENGNG